MKTKILIIDDDEELNRLLVSYLSRYEFEVLTASRPSIGLDLIRTAQPELIILDVMLPEKTGFEVCREIRSFSSIPIIMLTTRDRVDDRVQGLEWGADDYLPKPYEPRELVARVQSVLRRSRGRAVIQAQAVLQSGDLKVDLEKFSASLQGQDLELTSAEFAVLRLLTENAGRTLSREEIFLQIRGGHWDSVDRTVDVVVSRLRQKLKDDSKQCRYLKTMWGEGYRFVGPVSHA